MKKTAVVGAVLVLASLGVLAGGYHLLATERHAVESATRYAKELPVGTRVLVAGTVAEGNPVLVHSFVHAERERYSSGKKSSWTTVQSFVQELRIDVRGTPIIVTSERPCTRGAAVKTIDEPGAEKLRVRGIERGALFTAIGTLVSTSPPSVKAELTYGDTPEAYLADLRVGNRYLYISVGVMAAIGLALVARGRSRR